MARLSVPQSLGRQMQRAKILAQRKPRFCECCGKPISMIGKNGRLVGRSEYLARKMCSRDCTRFGVIPPLADYLGRLLDKSGGANACWPIKPVRRHKNMGHGFFKHKEKCYAAHRLAYALANGLDYWTIPTRMHVRHICDNPPCCNPAHLALGTAQDNINDMRSRGRERHPGGYESKQTKLTREQVEELRRRKRAGMSSPQLAAEYGVSTPTINRAISGRMAYA
jgi:hypothetical protein